MKNSTKKFFFILTIIFSVGIVLMITGLIFGGKSNIFFKEGKIMIGDNKNTIYHKEMNLNSFSNLSLNVRNANVYIINSDTFGIEYSYNSPNSNLNYSIKDNTLVFQEDPTFYISLLNFNFKENFVKIYVPKDTNFNDITIENKNGKVEIANINSQDIFINSYNGSITSNNLTSESIKLSSKNGAVTLRDATADKIEMSLSNGTLECDTISTGYLKADNKNGAILLYNTISSGSDISSSNGRIELSGEFKNNSNIKSSNGKIDIKNSSNTEYGYDIKCSNGSIYILGEKHKDTFISNSERSNKFKIISRNGSIHIDSMQ